ncbi:hypothetical protein IIA79_07805, partial [bacterium]|nr:hypothetical protein [bacterium]
MRKIYIGAFLTTLVLAGLACTSSQTTTPSFGSSRYDQDFRTPTQSSQSYPGQQPGEEALGPPPITVMLVSMETGDVYPGEDYFVYAVVDNPANENLEYVWSFAEGELAEVPESERGRLATLVETEYNTASATPPAAMGTEGEPPAVEEQAAAAGAPPTTAGVPPSLPTGGPPPGAGLPGSPPPTGTGNGAAPGATEAGVPESDSLFSTPGGGTGSPQQVGVPTNGQGQQGEPSPPAAGDTGGAEDIPAHIQAIEEKLSRGEELTEEEESQHFDYNAVNDPLYQDMPPEIKAIHKKDALGQEMTQDEMTRYQEYMQSTLEGGGPTPGLVPPPTASSWEPGERQLASLPMGRYAANPRGLILERRVVSGLQIEGASAGSDGEEEALEESLPIDADAAGEAAEDIQREAPAGAANVVEEALPADVLRPDFMDGLAGASKGGGGRLREEYQAWSDDGAAPRRRNLGGYGDGEEGEPLSAEESYEAASFVTDEPYIVWTPRTPGLVNIYVKVTQDGEDVAGPRMLEVDVRLRDPVVEIDDEFPDIVREDDAVYVKLAGENLPSFYKGLFTVSFEPTKLSF